MRHFHVTSRATPYAANANRLLRFVGSEWMDFATWGMAGVIRSLHVIDETNVWAIGVMDGIDHFVLFYDGTDWTIRRHASLDGFNAIWCDETGENVFVAGEAGEIWRLHDDVWELVTHKSKPVREAAAVGIAGIGPSVVPRAIELSKAKKQDHRHGAAIILGLVGDDAALAALEALVASEKSDDVRDPALEVLARAMKSADKEVDDAMIEARFARAQKAKKLAKPPLKWCDEKKLPKLTCGWSLLRRLSLQQAHLVHSRWRRPASIADRWPPTCTTRCILPARARNSSRTKRKPATMAGR